MIDILYDIHRLKVCQWAYGWSQDELISEIRKMISNKQWDYFFEQQRKEKESFNNLILEIRNNKFNFDICLKFPKENKHRSYGNKYIKRKFR
jgi:hypothetical protein